MSSPALDLARVTLMRVEHDSKSWTRRRSRSNHCPRIASPMVWLTLVPALGGIKWSGMWIEIRRRSLCSGVTVWSAAVIHSMFKDPGLKIASSSLLAFERLIDAGGDLARNGSKLFVQMHMPKGKVFLAIPCPREFPKMDTAGQGQQLTSNKLRPSHHKKPKRPGKLGRVRKLDDRGQPTGTIAIVDRRIVSNHNQVFEKRERKDEVENM